MTRNLCGPVRCPASDMAYKIIDTCTGCDLCVERCPITAISAGTPIYVIDDTCCDFQECLAVCPVNAIIPIEDGESH